ncbi:conserved hypothetical protein [Burkholderia ambifaria IOP40-10]|uniref:Fis family transcriptional regulator n=1 Tax=Burkholderia ambifaria IOP40-10 TaxID=396596 RepID=B1FHG0_9BURK|nr:hypothetical protein [Burkholderia ambifaria]EDT03021.1 conserved hypothetical protein [Burkholderia ambifaria IOP40-10]
MKQKQRRKGRAALPRGHLLPLATEKVKALSLENHLSLAVVRAGRAGDEQVGCLLRAVYLAYRLRDVTADSLDLEPYRQAEAALSACISRAERGEPWQLLDHELAAVEQMLLLHDGQLAAVSLHRYVLACEWLQRFMVECARSPISGVDHLQ